VGALTVLVACCGILLWAGRSLWESQHPAIAAARGLRAKSPAARLNAIRELTDLGIRDSTVAIAPLIAALEDPAAEVRVAAAEALGHFGPEAEAAIPALIAAVRQASAAEKPAAAFNTISPTEDGLRRAGEWSALSLGKIAPSTPSAAVALAVLMEALHSESPGTPRAQIMMATSEFGPKARGAIPGLRTLQKDPDQRIREFAAFVINKLKK
jgi:HEAT repeat protein